MNPKFLIPVLLCALLSSCFEIREEVNLKADGSGELTIVANLSASKGKVKQYLKIGHAEGHYVPSPHEVNTMLVKMKRVLEEVDGITYVQFKEDWSNYIFNVSIRFDKVAALNEGIKILSKNFDHLGLPTIDTENFSFRGNQFHRNFDYPPEPEKFAELPPVQQKMFEAAKLISIYRFEENIQKYSHHKAQLSPSGRAIMLQIPLADLATGKDTMANQIEF